MIRLLLADDHAIVRGGLKQLFSLSDDIEVAGEAATGGEVLQALQGEYPFDVLLLDMNMPGFSGADLICRVRARSPALPILVLSMHAEPSAVRMALRAGATGYLTKDVHPEVLPAAVRKVAGGARFLDPAVAEKLAFDAADGEELPHERLSNRESNVLRMLARGMTVNDIAAELSISNHTVSTHKARLMQKMNIDTNADLVRYAITYGLVD